jgi:hypothetical protein
MSRVFEGTIEQLSRETGYDYDFLVDMYNEVMEEDGDLDYFLGVTMERDW